MDEIRAKAEAARLDVLRNFPKPESGRRELTALTEMYQTAAMRAGRCPQLAEQLRLVKTHVQWAYKTYSLIFQHKNLNLSEKYRAEVRPLELPNCDGGSTASRQPSGLHLTTMCGSGPGQPSRLPPHVIQARLRQLRRIWRDGVVAAEVPDLVPLRPARTLAELKVSYAVHLANADRRPVRMPCVHFLGEALTSRFQVDLETICNMAAEARGGATSTIPATIAARLRPRH